MTDDEIKAEAERSALRAVRTAPLDDGEEQVQVRRGECWVQVADLPGHEAHVMHGDILGAMAGLAEAALREGLRRGVADVHCCPECCCPCRCTASGWKTEDTLPHECHCGGEHDEVSDEHD